MKYFYLLLIIIILSISTLYSQSDTNSTYARVEPELISKPELKFPEMAVKAGLQVSISLRIFIGTDGKPFKTEIVNREPEFVYLFDNDVRKWGMKFVFSPTIINGEAKIVTIDVPVKFKLDDFQPPEIREQAEPVYPSEALEMGLEGWIALAVLVDPHGNPEGTVNIISREPFYTNVFDNSAIDVAKGTKFRPAFTKGLSSYGWKFMKVVFKIKPR